MDSAAQDRGRSLVGGQPPNAGESPDTSAAQGRHYIFFFGRWRHVPGSVHRYWPYQRCTYYAGEHKWIGDRRAR